MKKIIFALLLGAMASPAHAFDGFGIEIGKPLPATVRAVGDDGALSAVPAPYDGLQTYRAAETGRGNVCGVVGLSAATDADTLDGALQRLQSSMTNRYGNAMHTKPATAVSDVWIWRIGEGAAARLRRRALDGGQFGFDLTYMTLKENCPI